MGERRNYTDSNQPQRRDQLYEEQIKDPYQARGKLPEPTVCPDCSASFHKGRWRWGSAPADANVHRCPACSRINDKAPAALLTLSGEFLSEHQAEIMNLVHNTEEKEKAEHPLERIMSVEQLPDSTGMQISFTGIHLAKSTGTALHHAYQGDFQFEYSERDSILRASWQR